MQTITIKRSQISELLREIFDFREKSETIIVNVTTFFDPMDEKQTAIINYYT